MDELEGGSTKKVYITNQPIIASIDANTELRTTTPTGKAMNVQIGIGDVIEYTPVVMSYHHHKIHQGQTFRYFTYVANLAKDANKDVRIFANNFTIPVGKNPAAYCPHFRMVVKSSLQSVAVLYEGATFTTAGTRFTNACQERNGTYTSKLEVYDDPTVNTLGSPIWKGFIVEGLYFDGAIEYEDSEYILKNNTEYFFRVTSGKEGNQVLIRFVWSEGL